MADLLAPFAGDRATQLSECLIDEFGSLARTLTVDASSIRDPDTAEACRIVQCSAALVSTAVREDLQGAVVAADDPSLLAYLRMHIGCAARERFHAVFLDRQARYLRDETVTLGQGSTLSVREDDLFARADALGAHQIIIAHNHPSGDCRPSRADVMTTQKLRRIAQAKGLLLVDHLIVTRSACFSIRAGRTL